MVAQTLTYRTCVPQKRQVVTIQATQMVRFDDVIKELGQTGVLEKVQQRKVMDKYVKCGRQVGE